MKNKEYILSLLEKLDIVYGTYKSSINRVPLETLREYEKEISYLIHEVTNLIEVQSD